MLTFINRVLSSGRMTAAVLLVGWAVPAWAQGAPSAADQEVVSDFEKFFVAGGWLVWGILLPLSVVTVSLIVQYFIMVRRGKILPAALVRRLTRQFSESQYELAREYLGKQGGVLSRTILAGLVEVNNGRGAMDLAMAETLEQEATQLHRRIEWLNIIGNVAPMIGLFGTVWGMINAFDGIVRAGGQPEPADLAGGISVALVTTWWGLIVAIPALAAYGSLRNRIDALAAEVALTAENLLRDVPAGSVEKEVDA